jgi:hypothetical protein
MGGGGFPHSCVASIVRTVGGDDCPLAETLVLFAQENDKIDYHAQYFMLHFEKVVLLQKECDKCWLCVCDIQHTPLIPHTASLECSTSMRHEIAGLSQISMYNFKYTYVRLSVTGTSLRV